MTVTLIEVDASTLAGTWNVAFRSAPSGFSVWLTVGSGLPNPVRTHLINEPLTWRIAAQVLADMFEDGLEGDRINDIVITGATGWRAEILKMSAITMVNPYYDQLQSLMELEEVDIEAVFGQFGTLLSAEAQQYILECWGEKVSEESTVTPRIKSEKYSKLEKMTASACPVDVDEVIAILNQWAAAKRKPVRNLSSNVSWSNERMWFLWLFCTSPNDLLVACAKKNEGAAHTIAAWLRLKIEDSVRQIEDLQKSRNQASQIGIGLHRSFVAAAAERLMTYDKFMASKS